MLGTLWTGFLAGLASLGKIAIIILPLIVVLEIIKDLGWLERASYILQPVLKRIHLSHRVAPALVAGFFIGITIGAGVLYQIQQEGKVEVREMTLLCLFLSLSHGVLEEIAIMAAMGAHVWVLFLTRFTSALLCTYLLSLWYYRGKRMVYNSELKE
ncbi:MAG: nucleoside recognition domain-containing protein [bacterium]|jgi:hypothetical protein